MQYFTTIGEYYGKDFIITEDEIKHDLKDCARNLREKENTSNKQNLVYEYKLLPLSTNHGGLQPVTKTKRCNTTSRHQR